MTIKEQIIAHCDDSLDQKLRKLLGDQQLGGKTNSALRILQSLGQGNDKLILLQSMGILPAEVCVALASLEDKPVEKLAKAADKLLEQLPRSSVNAIRASSAPQITRASASGQNSDEIKQLSSESGDLTKAIQAV